MLFIRKTLFISKQNFFLGFFENLISLIVFNKFNNLNRYNKYILLSVSIIKKIFYFFKCNLKFEFTKLLRFSISRNSLVR